MSSCDVVWWWMPWFGIFGFWNSAAQLFLLGVVSVVVGYGSYKKVKKESEKIVFLCKSCGNAWSEVDRNVNVGSKLPKFKIVKSCPSCNKNLSDEERRLLKLKP